MKIFKVLTLWSIAICGIEAMSAPLQHSYNFKLNYDEVYWFDGQSRHSTWSGDRSTFVEIKDDGAWADFDSNVFVHSICSKVANKSFPKNFSMVVGGTTSFSLNDDPFSRVRSTKMFVKVVSFNQTTGDLAITAACNWQYAGGGGGSLGISGIAIREKSVP